MRNFVSYFLAILLVAAFVYGLSEVWRWHFATGTVYPAYSSLRADPLGAKAFYEALERLPGLQVQRHYRLLRELPDAPGTTLLLLGLAEESLASLAGAVVKELHAFVQRGGRLVITLTPGPHRWQSQDAAVEAPEAAAGQESPSAEAPALSLQQHWGIEVDTLRVEPGKALPPAIQWPPYAAALPAALPWSSALVFTELHDDWKLFYGHEDYPVVIERTFGDGTVVLLADSYLVSNEALWRARHTALLAWLVGTPRTIVFHETHLGIAEQAGVMTLVRTYRLQGALLGLLGLAGLFAWRHASSLLPATPLMASSTMATVTGQESASALVSLLQRYVAPHDVLRLCVEEWYKAMPATRPGIQTKLAHMTQLVTQESTRAPRPQQLIEGYQALSRIVQTKR